MGTSLHLFDASVRLGRARDHIEGAPVSAEEMLLEMDEMGISEALVWHADAQYFNPHLGNHQLMVDVAEFPRLQPCWVFIPHETSEMPHPSAVLDEMCKAHIKAARIFPKEHVFLLREWSIADLAENLSAHRIPLFVDFSVKSWGNEYYDWDGLYEIGCAFPDLPLIITSNNIGSNRRLVPLMKRLPNLYVETSYYSVHRGIEFLASEVGADRILFGTGLPFRAAGPALTALTYSMISEEEKQLVAGDNLRRLLDEVIL
jgi:hypothetical protein